MKDNIESKFKKSEWIENEPICWWRSCGMIKRSTPGSKWTLRWLFHQLLIIILFIFWWGYMINFLSQAYKCIYTCKPQDFIQMLYHNHYAQCIYEIVYIDITKTLFSSIIKPTCSFTPINKKQDATAISIKQIPKLSLTAHGFLF